VPSLTSNSTGGMLRSPNPSLNRFVCPESTLIRSYFSFGDKCLRLAMWSSMSTAE